MGRLIPAGTGLSAYKRWKIAVDEAPGEAASLLPGMGPRSSSVSAQT